MRRNDRAWLDQRVMMRSDEIDIDQLWNIHDHEPWSSSDDDDLIEAVASGASLDEVAVFLCRAGNLRDVARRAASLGLKWRHGRLH